MNVLMLMAGDSAEFHDAGHIFPKNLVEINGLPLIQRVLEPVARLREGGHQIICALRRDEVARFHTDDVVRLLIAEAIVVEVPKPTAGAACTALLAVERINTDVPLLILNGDQVIDCDLQEVVDGFARRQWDGGVVVFEAVHPRWSYVRCDTDGFVTEAAEKRPISKLATAGSYYFARGGDFVDATIRMIEKDAHVDGVFYVAPVFNEMILKHRKIGIHLIPRDAYVSLATPQNVEAYDERLRMRMG